MINMGTDTSRELIAEARKANDHVSPLATEASEQQVAAYKHTIDRIALRLGTATTSIAIYEETKAELQQLVQGISQTVFRSGFEAGRDYEHEGGQT